MPDGLIESLGRDLPELLFLLLIVLRALSLFALMVFLKGDLLLLLANEFRASVVFLWDRMRLSMLLWLCAIRLLVGTKFLPNWLLM